jgi:hypothetical protein
MQVNAFCLKPGSRSSGSCCRWMWLTGVAIPVALDGVPSILLCRAWLATTQNEEQPVAGWGRTVLGKLNVRYWHKADIG